MGLNPLKLDIESEKYLRKVESVTEKIKNIKNYRFDGKYDGVNKEKNIILYDIFMEKLKCGVYKNRPGNPLKTIMKGKDKFILLSTESQCQVLMEVVSVFGRLTNGVNLSEIGGPKKAAATVGFNADISSLEGKVNCISLVDYDASGLHESRSVNLISLLWVGVLSWSRSAASLTARWVIWLYETMKSTVYFLMRSQYWSLKTPQYRLPGAFWTILLKRRSKSFFAMTGIIRCHSLFRRTDHLTIQEKYEHR